MQPKSALKIQQLQYICVQGERLDINSLALHVHMFSVRGWLCVMDLQRCNVNRSLCDTSF